jgi:tetratricopeptide (TPR) repeat protein
MMALKGNLNTVDLANIFQMLSLNQCEGTLYIFEGASRKAIYFAKDGVSMLSKGRPRSDALGRILVRQDHVSPEQLDAALAKQSTNAKLLGQILVDDGACTHADIEEALEIQIREEVCRLFLWKDAQFEFVEGEPDEEFRKEGVQRLTFSVNGIIVEAARRVDEWEWIQGVVPEMTEVYGYTGTNVDLKDSVFSEPFAGKVLAAIDGRRSVEEVIEASCVNKFEVCKILAILVESGAVAKLSADELAKQADAATAEGDGAATAKFLTRLVAANGETPEIHKRLAEAFQSMRELRKSAHHYGVYAEVRADARDVKEAFEIYRRICGLLPTDLAAADRMIELFASAPDGLEAHATEVVERGKKLAEIYMELKRPARAVQTLQRVASLGPDDLDLRKRLVTVYLASGMNSEAISEYEALADAALARRDYEEAETICRRILAIDRNRADISARIEQVVAKRRFRARGIRGLFVAAAAVAAASVATWRSTRPSAWISSSPSTRRCRPSSRNWTLSCASSPPTRPTSPRSPRRSRTACRASTPSRRASPSRARRSPTSASAAKRRPPRRRPGRSPTTSRPSRPPSSARRRTSAGSCARRPNCTSTRRSRCSRTSSRPGPCSESSTSRSSSPRSATDRSRRRRACSGSSSARTCAGT